MILEKQKMKKTLIIAAVAGMVMVSCKKDRVCSCKQVQDISPAPSVGQATIITDYEYTIIKEGYRTAYNHCTHTKTSNTTGSVTVSTDTNCSLK